MTEFERPVRIDTIGTAPRGISIEANPDERAALARRFDIASLDELTARIDVVRVAADVRATGSLHAELVQLCAATGADLRARHDVSFSVLFRSELPADVPDAGLELSDEECDVVFFDGAAVDLGEAVAETLALAIDPYARAADADAVLRAAGVVSEQDARTASGPFAALAGLNR